MVKVHLGGESAKMGFSRKKGGHVKFDWKSISATGGVQFFFLEKPNVAISSQD